MVLDLWQRCFQDDCPKDPSNPGKKINSIKPLKWILVDSIIIAIIAMVATMPATIPTQTELWVMLKAFIASFVFQLAIERGLKPLRRNNK